MTAEQVRRQSRSQQPCIYFSDNFKVLQDRQDADIETTSTVLSLKCPLSATRIVLPMRSRNCHHIQCFDASSYLMLQEQAPTWTCPICNRPASYDSLQVDHYVKEILSKTSKDTEQVTVDPKGDWHLQSQPHSTDLRTTRSSTAQHTPPDEDDEFDDFIEIHDPSTTVTLPPLVTDRLSNLRQPSIPATFRTPPASSREPSIASSAPRTSSKRPASEVIDLTLSDDEDEDAHRPAKIKRPSMTSSLNSNSFRTDPGSANPYSTIASIRPHNTSTTSTPTDRPNFSPYAFTFNRGPPFLPGPRAAESSASPAEYRLPGLGDSP